MKCFSLMLFDVRYESALESSSLVKEIWGRTGGDFFLVNADTIIAYLSDMCAVWEKSIDTFLYQGP